MQDEKLTLAAAALARAAPNAWQEFLVALKAYADRRKDECVQSSLEELQRTQGRAQLAASLFDLLGDAVKDADRISKQRERRSN
jgi:hypothetical protein